MGVTVDKSGDNHTISKINHLDTIPLCQLHLIVMLGADVDDLVSVNNQAIVEFRVGSLAILMIGEAAIEENSPGHSWSGWLPVCCSRDHVLCGDFENPYL